MPTNYTTGMIDPSGSIVQGLSTGLNMQGAQQALQMNEAAEARARELHPLAVAGAQQDMTLAANRDNRENAAEVRAQAVFDQQQAAAAEAEARRTAFQEAMGNLAGLGASATVEDYAGVANQFPEFSESLMETWETMDDSRKQGTARVLGQAAIALRGGNAERAIAIAEEYAVAAENSGDVQGAATARSLVETMKASPDAGLASIGLALTQLDPEMASMAIGQGSSVQTTQMIAGRISVQTMRDGTTQVVDTATNRVLTGQEARDAIAEAESAVGEAERIKTRGRGTGENEADVETGSQAEAAKGFGEAQVTFVTDALASASTVRGNIRTMDEAIQAIDDGAQAGLIYNRMPRITEAGATLQNAMDRMGLDVIGSVTFGALSEGELRLAMSTAVPRGLSAPELRNWLVQRRDAQEKVLAALTEQAEFLSNPENTLNDWVTRVDGAGGLAAESAPETPQRRSYMDLLD